MWGLMIRSNTICRFCRILTPASASVKAAAVANDCRVDQPTLSQSFPSRLPSHAGPTLASGEMRIRPTDAHVQTEHLLRGFLHQLATRRAKILWKSGAGATA